MMNNVNLLTKIWDILRGTQKVSYYNNQQEGRMATPINIEITLKVTGDEGLNATLTYTNTTLETAVKVENALLTALANLNIEHMSGK